MNKRTDELRSQHEKASTQIGIRVPWKPPRLPFSSGDNNRSAAKRWIVIFTLLVLVAAAALWFLLGKG